MRMAIEKAREGIRAGQTPFGACIVSAKGDVIACDHNVVWATTDITAHGEVNTIRAACKALGSIDLSGSVIYSTTEPCPMCFSAIHWAKISRIVFGASIADARAAGFNELVIANTLMKDKGRSSVEVDGGCLREACRALFQEWKDSGMARAY